jgi:prolyl 4-hydroxylase
MVNLNDLIQIHENALSKELCDALIQLYERKTEYQERVDNYKRPTFTQFNLTSNFDDLEVAELQRQVMATMGNYLKQYYHLVDKRCFPREHQHGFEQFRIKKYKNDGNDMFNTHVDVQDHMTAKRYLSFFWYLNDVHEGGETEFVDLTIKPEAGKLVIFPPLWMFPHKGNPPISNDKYLLSTYLHYL